MASKRRRWLPRFNPQRDIDQRAEPGVVDHTTGAESAAYHFTVWGNRPTKDGSRRPVRVHRAITAAAQTLVDTRIKRNHPIPKGSKAGAEWDVEAFELYDETPELHYGVSWAANQLSRVRLVAAEIGDDGTPVPIQLDTEADDEPLDEVARRAALEVAQLAGGPTGQAQLLFRAGQQLTVAGESYIVMRQLTPDPATEEDGGPVDLRTPNTPANTPATAAELAQVDDETDHDTSDDQWLVRAYSRNEVGADSQGVDARWWIDEGNGVKEYLDAGSFVVLRVWRPHPNTFQHADSAVRAALPVLRELRALTMHVSAQVDSRLAGAGILFVPQEMTFASSGPREDNADDEEEDPLMRDLVVSMMTAYKDRGSAAALVPLLAKVPGEFLKDIRHLSFSTPLDAAAEKLRSEAIRRLALGLDMPPEIVLGMADLNHWSAWLSDEAAIKISTSPTAALLCHVLTTGWLRPLLEETGATPERARNIMVWFDTVALETRPDQGESARDAYDRGEVSGDTLRRETGFGDADKMSEEEFERWLLVKLLLARPDLAEKVLPVLGIDLPTTSTPATPPPPVAPSPPGASGGDANPPDDDRQPGGERALPERETVPPEAQGQTIAGVTR